MTAYSPDGLQRFLTALAASERRWVGFKAEASPPVGRLRVDVDYHMGLAVEMARLIQTAGLSATFFLRTDAPLYNLLSLEGRQAVADLRDLGHAIGLHYEGPPERERLSGAFRFLEGLSQEVERVVAWHNPPEEMAALNRTATEAGLRSAYEPVLFGPGRYFSDSNMRRTPEEILARLGASDAEEVQVLLHPVTWMVGGATMEAALEGLCRRLGRNADHALMENDLWKERSKRRSAP